MRTVVAALDLTGRFSYRYSQFLIDGPRQFEGHSWPFAAAGRPRPDVYVGSSTGRPILFFRIPAAAKAAAGIRCARLAGPAVNRGPNTACGGERP